MAAGKSYLFLANISWLSKPILLCLGLIQLPMLCLAQQTQMDSASPREYSPRNDAWSMGLALSRQFLKTTDGPERQWNVLCPHIFIERVWIHERSWMSLDFRLALGPNSQQFEDSPKLDYTGMGFGATWAMTLTGQDLRSSEGDWGVSLAAGFQDWRGRSFRPRPLASGEISDNWVVSIRHLYFSPGLFYSRLKPSRPKGYRPEWIVTRLEGYTFQLGLEVPTQSSLDFAATKDAKSIAENRPWKGYGVALKFATWLGI